ncbi:hypothetical protein B7463_g2431, partial [Scytalidium lignicola]
MAATRPQDVADMASSDEPAAKRVKLTTSGTNTSSPIPPPASTHISPTTASVGNTSNNNNTVTTKMEEFRSSNFEFQHDKEAEHGILCFVNSSNPGFSGVFKHRYTDFLVNEIMPDGTVAHLTNDQAPSYNAPEEIKPTEAPKPMDSTPSDAQATKPVDEEVELKAIDSTPSNLQVTNPSDDQVESKQEHSTLPVPNIDEPPDPWEDSDPKVPEGEVEGSGDKADTEVVNLPNVDQQTIVEAESGIITLPSTVPEIEKPTSSDSQDNMTFTLSSEDDVLLTKYFGEDLKNEVIRLYKNILSKPNAKPTAFDSLLTSPIADRVFRGKLHHDVRRIFQSYLETESLNNGVIKIMAATRTQRRPPNPNKNGSRQSGGRSKGGNSSRNQSKGKLGWQELGGEYLHFSLYKENKDTMEVISYLCSLLKIKPKDFSFAGTKDRRGVTVQRVSVFRQHAENLARLNPQLRGARLGNFKYEKHGLGLGELQGNQFHITLRDCHFDSDSDLDEDQRVELANKVVGDAVSHLQAHGFINYFGLQRFGSFEIGTDQIGKLILKGDFEGAVLAILAVSGETLAAALFKETSPSHNIGRDDILRAQAIHSFKSTGESANALHKLPRRFNAESAIIRYLGNPRTRTDFTGAILKIPRNLRTMYVHAYQSLVWNTVASHRWNKYGDKVIKGDLVLVEAQSSLITDNQDEVDENGEIVVRPAADDTAVSHDDFFQRARPLTEEEAQSGKWTIFDIVLPTPGFDINYPDNDIGEYYKEIMATERFGGLDPAKMRRKEKDFSLSGSYRNVLAAVGSDLAFQIKTYHDETEQLVETDLEKLRKANPERYPNDTFNKETRRFENNQDTRKYIGTPQHNAWLNLPAKLAAEDKAAAAMADIQRELDLKDSTGPNDIKQPTFKETFIETDVDNEGKRTGHRSTTLINSLEGSETSKSVEPSNAGQHNPPENKVADEELEVVGKYKSDLREEEAPMEQAPEPAKIAVIIKFSLGQSQYATMALRELMKVGNVKNYKPEFSSGR